MTAVALVAVVACRPAGAEPASRGAAERPAGWTQLAPIAAAAGAAARADGVVIDAVDAWGEPALGCYAVWLALHGGTAGAPALADQVLAGFAGTAISELTRPTGSDGVLAFAFARPPYRGRLHAHLGEGRIAAVACFGSPREPAACEAACRRVLQGAPGATP